MISKFVMISIVLLMYTLKVSASVMSISELDLSKEADLQQIIEKNFTICSTDGVVRVKFSHDHRALYAKHPRYDLGIFDFGTDSSTRIETEWFIDGKRICEKEIGTKNVDLTRCKSISRGLRKDYFFVKDIIQDQTWSYSMQECLDENFNCDCGGYNQF